jgi:hypothetical protein
MKAQAQKAAEAQQAIMAPQEASGAVNHLAGADMETNYALTQLTQGAQ